MKEKKDNRNMSNCPAWKLTCFLPRIWGRNVNSERKLRTLPLTETERRLMIIEICRHPQTGQLTNIFPRKQGDLCYISPHGER